MLRTNFMSARGLMNNEVTNQTERNAMFNKLLKDFTAVMFITLEDGGGLALRPMQVIEAKEDGVLWFVSSKDSGKVSKAQQFDTVYLTAQSGNSVFVAARGRPEIFSDIETKQRLWSEPLRIWFPKGLEDPSLCFIRLTIEEGEYWNTAGIHKLSYLFKSLQAYVSKTTPDVDDKGHHGKISMM